MSILYAALGALFIIEVIFFWAPWRVISELAAILLIAVAFAIFYVASDYVVSTLAIAGSTLLLRQVFRLVRAWADRTELANVLPIQRGNR